MHNLHECQYFLQIRVIDEISGIGIGAGFSVGSGSGADFLAKDARKVGLVHESRPFGNFRDGEGGVSQKRGRNVEPDGIDVRHCAHSADLVEMLVERGAVRRESRCDRIERKIRVIVGMDILEDRLERV